MLAIHWSPVKNTKAILRNGIRKGRRGLFCFPLTGHASVDRWWAQAFQSWRPRTPYNGFVFRIVQGDLPARFCDWIVDAIGQAKVFESLAELEAEYRGTLVWRIGHAGASGLVDDYESIGAKLIRKDPSLCGRYQSDPGWMDSVFHDCQIVLARSIDARRILRVVPGSKRSGREQVRRQRASSPQ